MGKILLTWLEPVGQFEFSHYGFGKCPGDWVPRHDSENWMWPLSMPGLPFKVPLHLATNKTDAALTLLLFDHFQNKDSSNMGHTQDSTQTVCSESSEMLFVSVLGK